MMVSNLGSKFLGTFFEVLAGKFYSWQFNLFTFLLDLDFGRKLKILIFLVEIQFV